MDANERRTAERLGEDFRRAMPWVREIEPKAAGGSGYVFRVKKEDGDVVALKIFRPDQNDQPELLEGFEEEGRLLREIHHPRIVKGFSTGQMRFDSFPVELPYYEMEYLPHDSLDKVLERLPKSIPVYLSLLSQALEALEYLHALNPPRCHLDVKEANLLVDMTVPASPQLKLSDLGVSKTISRDDRSTEVRGSLFYWPQEWQEKLKRQIPTNNNRVRIRLPRKDIPTTVDLHMLSVAFARVLGDRLGDRQESYWYRALSLLLEKMDWDRGERSTRREKYATASEVIDDLRMLQRTPALPPPLEETGSVRVPIISLPSLDEGLRELIDSPWFQRLRRVRQLGVAHLVYPGAVHTRFEHAIGTYAQALQYVRALLENKNSPWFAMHFRPDEIKALALSALCHDLGHYPFAHQMEDLEVEDVWPKHEALSYYIISGTITEKYTGLTAVFGDPTSLAESIKRHWGLDPELLMKFFAYCYRHELEGTEATPTPADVPRSWRGAAQIVSGPIDADKFDYLRRDSHHTGVSYGFVSDPGRFLSSLTIAFDTLGTHLGVTEKGRVDAEFIPVVRYAMFSEVYWHHTVRAFTAMIRKALQLGFEWKDNPLTIEKLLRWSDDRVIRHLQERAEERKAVAVSELVKLIAGRRPYTRLFTLTKQANQRLYETLTERRIGLMRGDHWKEDKLMVAEIFGFKTIEPHHLLWDIPKPGKDRLEDVRIADIHGDVVADNPGPLWASLSENFEKWVRKIRLFVHPDNRPRRLSSKDEIKRNKDVQRKLSERLGA